MQTQINAFLENKNGGLVVKVFGYVTKGVPGIEIVGLGKYGNTIKQKFIFLSRQREIKFKAKRYVICLEQNDIQRSLELDDVRWLEFPLLLILWYLAGIIPIKSLEDCLCSGYICTNGEVHHPNLTSKLTDYLKKLNEFEYKMISVPEKSMEDFYLIESAELLSEIPNLKFA